MPPIPIGDQGGFRAWTRSEASAPPMRGRGANKVNYISGPPEFEGFESVLALSMSDKAA